MSLPASARHRWGLEHGGEVGYLDIGEAIVLVPGGLGVAAAAAPSQAAPESGTLIEMPPSLAGECVLAVVLPQAPASNEVEQCRDSWTRLADADVKVHAT